MNRNFAAVLTAIAVFGSSSTVLAQDSDWVMRSNANAQVVLELLAEFNPEGAGGLGVDGLDEDVVDLRPNLYERRRSAAEAVLAELQRRKSAETDRKVKQDLGILIKAVEDGMRSAELNREHMLPYYNLNQTVFQGVRTN